MPCTPLTNPHYPSPGERHRAICQGRRLAPMPLEIDASPLEIEERSTGDGISRAAGDARPHHIQLPHPQESTRRTTHHTHSQRSNAAGAARKGPCPRSQKRHVLLGKHMQREAGDGHGSSMCSFPYHLAPISRTISRPLRPHPPSPAHFPPSPGLSRPLPPSPHNASTPALAPHRAWRAIGPDPHPENMIGLARRAPHHVNRCGGRPRPIYRPWVVAAACLHLTGCGPLHTMGLSAIRPEGSPPQPTAPHCSPHQMAHALYACSPRTLTLPGEPAQSALSIAASPRLNRRRRAMCRYATPYPLQHGQ